LGFTGSAHELAVFRLDRSLSDEKQHEAGGEKRHAELHVDGDRQSLEAGRLLVADHVTRRPRQRMVYGDQRQISESDDATEKRVGKRV